MIDIIQEYWKSLLWTDGYRFTGDYALAADLFRGDGRHPGGFPRHWPSVEQ